MILTYWMRLFCLCLSTGLCCFVLGSLLAGVFAPWALRRLGEQSPAATSAHRLLALRLAPGLVAIAIVGGWCIPSYLWLEPVGGAELVGRAVLGLTAAGALLVLWIAVRAAIGGCRSLRFGLWARRHGQVRQVGGVRVRVLPRSTPMLVLAGLLRSHIVMSQQAWTRLSEPQLEAGLRHERAHLRARDNWKRLAVFAVPAWSAHLREVERAWQRRIEWAADDRAVAGDARRSLTLAATLIELARGESGARPLAPISCLSLGSSRSDRNRELAVRVHRLLAPTAGVPQPRIGLWRWASAAALTVVAALMLQPATLLAVHQVLERLAH